MHEKHDRFDLSFFVYILIFTSLFLFLSIFILFVLISPFSSLLFSPLFSPRLFHPLSLSHNMKRVSSDSMPWSRKCESTLLRALKVVLLEGLLLERPWTVHWEKSFAKESNAQWKITRKKELEWIKERSIFSALDKSRFRPFDKEIDKKIDAARERKANMNKKFTI